MRIDVLVGLGQVDEHLVVAERQAVRGEVGLERGVEVEHRLGVARATPPSPRRRASASVRVALGRTVLLTTTMLAACSSQ